MRQSTIFNKPPQQPVPMSFLSMEEEAIMDVEASDNLLDVKETCDQVDRLVAVSDAIEDTVTIVDKTPNIGLTETSLLDTISNMVVAGSDAEPDAIVPGVAMEDAMVPYGQNKDDHTYKPGETKTADKEKTAGSLKEKLAKIWETIMSFLAACWEHLKKAASYFYANADKLKRAVAAAMEIGKGGGGSPKNTHVMVTDAFGATVVDGKGFMSQDWLDRMMGKKPNPEEHMNRFLKAVQVLTVQVPEQQKKIGEEIKGLLEGFDPKNPTGSVSEDVFRLHNLMGTYATALVGLGEKPTSTKDGTVSKGLMGNFAINFHGLKATSNDLWETLDELNKMRFGIVSPPVKEQGHSYNFPVYSPAVSLQELKKYDQIADLMLAFKNKHVTESNLKIAEAIKSVSAKIASRNDEISEEASNVGKALIKLNAAYSNWLSQPQLAAMQRMCRVCLFFVSVHAKSLKEYA